jgi:surface polysaccharide O-acyltransferase-like enzyme
MPKDNPHTRYGYIGLIVFLLISNMLPFLKKEKSLHFPQYASKKAQRILLPFVAWSLFYLLISVYMSGVDAALNNLSVTSIFSGTFYHLWYLPYIYFTLIFIYLIRRNTWTNRLIDLPVRSILTIGILILLCQSFLVSAYDLETPFVQWLTSIPCLFLGLCVGKSLSSSEKSVPMFVPISVAIVAIVALLEFTQHGSQMYSLSYGIGFPLFCLSFSLEKLPQKVSTTIDFLSKLTLGVYLVHPFFIILFIKYYPSAPLAVHFCLVLIASFLGTYILKKVPIIQRIV